MENHVGEELCRLFTEDSDVEWSSVLRRSKESARRVGSASGGSVGNSRSRGPMAPLQLQQQQHQQHLQSSSSRQQQQRSFRERNRNRGGGFGAGGRAGDMGRYTNQSTKKNQSKNNYLWTFQSVIKCTSPTLVPSNVKWLGESCDTANSSVQ